MKYCFSRDDEKEKKGTPENDRRILGLNVVSIIVSTVCPTEKKNKKKNSKF